MPRTLRCSRLPCARGRGDRRAAAADPSGDSSAGAAARRPRRAGHRHAADVHLQRHGQRRDPRPVPQAEPRSRPEDGDLRQRPGGRREARRRVRGRRRQRLLRRVSAAGHAGPAAADRPGGRSRAGTSSPFATTRASSAPTALVNFVPVAAGPQGLLYNTEEVVPPPDSWADLFDPAYAGRVSIDGGTWLTPIAETARGAGRRGPDGAHRRAGRGGEAEADRLASRSSAPSPARTPRS